MFHEVQFPQACLGRTFGRAEGWLSIQTTLGMNLADLDEWGFANPRCVYTALTHFRGALGPPSSTLPTTKSVSASRFQEVLNAQEE